MAEHQEKPPLVPDKVDWDYRLSVPTQWHIRGKNPQMHIVSEEQMETLASSGNPLPLNFCFFTGGIAGALIIQLVSGVVDPNAKQILWMAFFVMSILTAFFGGLAIRDHRNTSKRKQAIKQQTPTVQAEPPTVQARQE